MTNNTQHSDEWEKPLEKIMFLYSKGLFSGEPKPWTDYPELIEYISHLLQSVREESYKKGFIDGADATAIQIEELKIEELKAAKKEAQEEVIQMIIIEVIKLIGDKMPEEKYGGEFTDGYRAGIHDAKNLAHHYLLTQLKQDK